MKSRRPQSPTDKSAAETGSIFKQGRGLVKAALVYPNTYRTGMSNLGFQTVYRLANELKHVQCQRVFLPDRQDFSQRIVSVESHQPLDQFDIILFSISFENDFIHLVHLLREAGLPPRSSDRNTIHPLVVAGGVACFLNPEPIADFIDCFLLGEAEQLINGFFNLYDRYPDRSTLLDIIESNLPGAYVPSLRSPICWQPPQTAGPEPEIPIQHVPDLSGIVTCTQVLTRHTAFSQRVLIETGRGCPHGCRFCSAGFIYRPPRTYPLSNIVQAMDSASMITPRIGLVSSAVSNHPDINQICSHGIEKQLDLSFSSLRADALTEDLVSGMARSGVKTATIAPEAGSQRMRDTINKKLDEAVILSCVSRFINAGIPNLRLYFMIGLPHETKDDVQAIVDLTLKIKHTFLECSREQHRIGTITLSINPFIPKPATPFQWAAMQPLKILRSRMNLIKSGLKKVSNLKISFESLKQARINALLSRADRTGSKIIEEALKNGWTHVLKSFPDYVNTVVHTTHDPDTVFPWEFLDSGVARSFLLDEYNRAGRARTTRACPMIDCNDCRLCKN